MIQFGIDLWLFKKSGLSDWQKGFGFHRQKSVAVTWSQTKLKRRAEEKLKATTNDYDDDEKKEAERSRRKRNKSRKAEILQI